MTWSSTDTGGRGSRRRRRSSRRFSSPPSAAGRAAGGAGGCVERTRLLVGPDVPTSWHAPVLVLGALAAGVAAWLLLTVVARRAARRGGR